MKYYTDEKNAQILIETLKQNGIRKVIASPGGTNICFVASMQCDSFFEIYSAPDERSAAYMACGMAAELDGNEVIVLSCTGATASRNYMPGLTEAFYRKLPILVVTSSKSNYEIGHNIEQVTDRTLLPKDIAKMSVQMPTIYDKKTEWACNIAANKAVLELLHGEPGPVHINLETEYSRNYSVKKLPNSRVIRRYTINSEFPPIPSDRLCIVVGSHVRFSVELTEKIEKFCEQHNGVVFCDHTSNYRGKYRIFPNIIALQKNLETDVLKMGLAIHIGNVSASTFSIDAKKVWRISRDGMIVDTYKKLEAVFEMDEKAFFSHYCDDSNCFNITYYENCYEQIKRIENQIPELPFSISWVARESVKLFPKKTVLHLGIRNSLRAFNYFDTDSEILGYSNTGGFGIDGCISSTIGASLVDKTKIFYCFLGDLAFFYDMNSLGNRHVGNNLRIVLFNNGCGAEFWLSNSAAPIFGEETNSYIAAAGHYGKKSRSLVKNFSENLGFEYIAIENKNDFKSSCDKIFSSKIGDRPLVVEIFTDAKNDVKALDILSEIDQTNSLKMVNLLKDTTRNIVGETCVTSIKRMMNKR